MIDAIAIVGCGKQKLDLEGKGAVPIARLYTSTYYELKRDYAKVCCDRYYVLSAKHGLALPGMYVEESYDLTIDDLDDNALDAWAADVAGDLRAIGTHHPVDPIVVLAGKQYVAPLWDVLRALPNPVRCPFEQTDGIGEQMAWLKAEIEAADAPDRDEQQERLTLEDFEEGSA